VARNQLRRGGAESLVTTALVHEAYLKLAADARAAWTDRVHFFAVAARAMRQILIDHARTRGRAKRGSGQQHASLDENVAQVSAEAERLLALDQALERLERQDERAVRVVECRYFVGLDEQETALALGLSVRSVQRAWQQARAWLARELAAG
jgi:RNA polymerase sigma factor (TIGR02999 family)